MSEPKAPYYYKDIPSPVYHWEKSCSNNHWNSEGWVESNEPPSDGEQCDQCKGK